VGEGRQAHVNSYPGRPSPVPGDGGPCTARGYPAASVGVVRAHRRYATAAGPAIVPGHRGEACRTGLPGSPPAVAGRGVGPGGHQPPGGAISRVTSHERWAGQTSPGSIRSPRDIRSQARPGCQRAGTGGRAPRAVRREKGPGPCGGKNPGLWGRDLNRQVGALRTQMPETPDCFR
jgi:hypothetical protein